MKRNFSGEVLKEIFYQMRKAFTVPLSLWQNISKMHEKEKYYKKNMTKIQWSNIFKIYSPWTKSYALKYTLDIYNVTFAKRYLQIKTVNNTFVLEIAFVLQMAFSYLSNLHVT